MKNAKLFVGGLSYSTDEDKLLDLFSTCGQVLSAKIIRDKFSGDSKGFAFVEMSSFEDAQDAMEKLNGTNLDGRNISVNEAKERAPRRGGFGDRGDRGGDRGDRGGFGGDRGGDRGGRRRF